MAQPTEVACDRCGRVFLLPPAQERGSILALRVQSLEHSRRLDYELVERFDVYRTGGDLSSCLREMLMRISEMETALSERA